MHHAVSHEHFVHLLAPQFCAIILSNAQRCPMLNKTGHSAMAAIEDLWKQTTGKIKSLVTRYWLLASRPSIYFDKFIKDQNARELGRTILHTVITLSAIPISFSALSKLTSDLFGQAMPAWLVTTLTSQYLFLFFVIVATIPAFLVTLLIYLLVRASISDLVFTYFNVLTLYGIGFFALFPLLWLIGLAVMAVSWVATGKLFFQADVFESSLWVPFSILLLPYFTMLTIYYYVPTILIERSTNRSTLFGSTVCLLYFTISGLFMAIVYQSTIGPIQMNSLESRALDLCARQRGALPDLIIAAYFKRNEYDRAIEDYTMAIKLHPKYAEAFYNRGTAYRAKSKSATNPRAKADFEAHAKADIDAADRIGGP